MGIMSYQHGLNAAGIAVHGRNADCIALHTGSWKDGDGIRCRSALDDALARGDFEPDPDRLREDREERRRLAAQEDGGMTEAPKADSGRTGADCRKASRGLHFRMDGGS